MHLRACAAKSATNRLQCRQFLRLLMLFSFIGPATIASAQNDLPTVSGGDLRQHQAFETLPAAIKLSVDAAIEYYNKYEAQNSIRALDAIRRQMTETTPYKSLFCAWLHQWRAFNYDLLKNRDSVKTYVKHSIRANTEIWRDYEYFRVPQGVREIYQESWNETQEEFAKKRRSWRVALGPVFRVDFSNHYGIIAGLGTAVKTQAINDNTQLFENLLLYMRRQWMRKNIERLSAGLYGEFSFLIPLEKRNWKTLNKISPIKAISFGPVLGYTYQSGWELGGTVEAVRLDIGRDKTRISQTATLKDKLAFLSYANFELYIRKWF